jgi:hypothetical protein
MGVVWPLPKAKPSNCFLRVWPKGLLNHPLWPWGWFGHPRRLAWRVTEPLPGQTGWPATPYGVVRSPQHISSSFFFFGFFYFFLKIKYVMGRFWEKKRRSKWSNCNNLKVLGGLSVTFETLGVKMQMGG